MKFGVWIYSKKGNCKINHTDNVTSLIAIVLAISRWPGPGTKKVSWLTLLCHHELQLIVFNTLQSLQCATHVWHLELFGNRVWGGALAREPSVCVLHRSNRARHLLRKPLWDCPLLTRAPTAPACHEAAVQENEDERRVLLPGGEVG